MDIIHPGQQNKQLMCSSMDELTPKVRKPYTITKQRERWTEDEHHKFLEALKLHGRAWRRIEEHIGTKTAVQIRSHAQKFFSKVARDSAMGGAAPLEPIEIPPPRPKKKPVHPYPRKLGNSSPKSQASPVAEERSPSPVSSLSEHENLSPTSVLSAVGSPDHSGVEENASQKTDLSDEATAAAPTSLKLFGRTVQVAAASPQKPSSPVQEPESQRVPSSCEWSAWPWGMMPQIIYCPSVVPDLASATEAAAVASSLPWWASLQFMPLTSYQGNPPPEQKESSDVTAGEETGSSSENEGRGFVPYRRCLAERKAGQLEPPAEGIRLCL